MTAHAERWAGRILLSIVALVVGAMFVHELFVPLSYDEGYNLQVSSSLAKGNGYASFGALRGDGPWQFDPNVTTGPVVLVPLALLWLVAPGDLLVIRVAMLAFALAYLWGLFAFVDDRGRRRSLAIAALATALLVSIPAGAVLGEVPAAAGVMWAAWAVSRNRPHLAGLLVGLVVQTKLPYVLLAATVMVAWCGVAAAEKQPGWIRKVLGAASLAALPSLCLELWRFMAFGTADDYLFSVDQLQRFLQTQRVENWLDPILIGQKVAGLHFLLVSSGWVALVVVGFIQVWALFSPFHEASKTSGSDRSYWVAAAAAVAVGALLLLIAWITKSSQVAARQGLPFLLLFLPLLAAATAQQLGASRSLCLSSSHGVKRGLLVSGYCFLVVALALKAERLVQDKLPARQLADQLQVVDVIRNSGAESLVVDGWWQSPEYQVLADVPGVLAGGATGRSLLVVPAYVSMFTGISLEQYTKQCGEILYSSRDALVCWSSAKSPRPVDLRVIDFHPRFSVVGEIPNRQPDGGAGLQIKLEKRNLHEFGRLQVYISGRLADVHYQDPNGEIISVSVPRRLFMTVGKKPIVIKQMSTGNSFEIGEFSVLPKGGKDIP